MSEYGDMTLDQYRDALASDDPTPGGGTAAAVALAQGAALTVMVCNLTEGREKWAEGQEAAKAARAVAEPLLERAHVLAHEDAHSFDGVMAAFRMAKDTEEEKVARRSAIHTGTLAAAEVPMETARLAYGLLHTLPALAELGNSNAVTDVGVASLLASAACKGALFNVEINVLGIPDELGAPLKAELDDLRERCRDLSRVIMSAVHDRMHA